MDSTQPSTPLVASAETTSAVLAHHLGAFAKGIDEIMADYDESSVLITPDRIFRGLADIHGFFERFLDQATPQFWEAFELGAHSVESDIAYITWWSEPAVTLATDTLLVRGGRIAIQTFTSFAR